MVLFEDLKLFSSIRMCIFLLKSHCYLFSFFWNLILRPNKHQESTPWITPSQIIDPNGEWANFCSRVSITEWTSRSCPRKDCSRGRWWFPEAFFSPSLALSCCCFPAHHGWRLHPTRLFLWLLLRHALDCEQSSLLCLPCSLLHMRCQLVFRLAFYRAKWLSTPEMTQERRNFMF